MVSDKKMTVQEAADKGLLSQDIAAEKRAALKQIFPEVFSENGIDFEHLRRVLGDWAEPGKERFGLTWPGKAECMKVIQAPGTGTLKPVHGESVNFDETENVFIEGDNLEVLKLMQKAYFGKIKMIYIDPPYNTGNEFIYPDKFSETLETYLKYTGQIDGNGSKFSTNTEENGRYHSNWLNMMYPRLYLARNLLREDGVILISIDDHEAGNLNKICNEIFGEENFIAQIVWEKTRKNDAKLFSVGHEYLFVYARSLQFLKDEKTVWRESKPGAKEITEHYGLLRKQYGDNHGAVQTALRQWYSELAEKHPSKKLSRYKWVDKHGPWRDRDISWPGGGGPRYDVIHPVTKKPCRVPERGWGFADPQSMQRQIDLKLVVFRDDHTEPPFRKAHLIPLADELDDNGVLQNGNGEEENNVGLQVMPSVIYKQSQVAVKYLRKIMGGKIFDNPKDHEVLGRFIRYCGGSDKNFTFLDFFAGAASSAEAVLQMNHEDNGARKVICIQLPEPCKEGTAAFEAGYETIAKVSKERIHRAAKKITDEREGNLNFNGEGKLDLGFRVFKLAYSNFRIWDGDIEKADTLEEQLEAHVGHVDSESGPEDILYELLLKAGYELTTKVEKRTMEGKDVYAVDGGALLICLEKEITEALIDAMAKAGPREVICLDEGFNGDDELKTNAVETFKLFSESEESETVFRTV